MNRPVTVRTERDSIIDGIRTALRERLHMVDF
jgi:hypothetical protein